MALFDISLNNIDLPCMKMSSKPYVCTYHMHVCTYISMYLPFACTYCNYYDVAPLHACIITYAYYVRLDHVYVLYLYVIVCSCVYVRCLVTVTWLYPCI